MIRLCSEQDRSTLIEFLNQEPEFHTFMLADIQQHGFHQEYQKVYLQADSGQCQGVFLTFYQNLLVAGDAEKIDYAAVAALADDRITTIMGNAEIVQRTARQLGGHFTVVRNNLYVHRMDETESPDCQEIRIATEHDIDQIYSFLMSFPEFRGLYGEKGMLENRIRNGEGIDIVMEKNGRIIAHGNSAASAEKTSMLGGICVEESYRGRGYAGKIVRTLCKLVHAQGKMPCIFVPEAEGLTILTENHFSVHGKWGVAKR